jgi:hypothetical protein
VPRRDAYPDANSHGHRNPGCNCYANCHDYGYFDAETYAYTTFRAFAEAASDTRTASESIAVAEAPATIEPGITSTHAPQVRALEFIGQNVLC